MTPKEITPKEITPKEITPKAFANFSPGFERSENPGYAIENMGEP
jgi:hypothetical protein